MSVCCLAPAGMPDAGGRARRGRLWTRALAAMLALSLTACATAPTVQIGGQPPPPTSGRGVNAYGFP